LKACRQETDTRGTSAHAGELPTLRAGGYNLVFPVFFYTMGETQMGRYKSSSWTLHMASIIILSSLWGIGLKESKGAGIKAARIGAGAARGIDDDRRVRQLSRAAASPNPRAAR